MSIKRILVPLPGLVDHAGEVDMALSAAKALSAHVEALFINPPPPPVRGMRVAEGYAGTAVPRAVNWFAEEQEMRAREAREGFVRACSASGIPLVVDADEPMALPAASWRQAEGTYDRIAAERAAAFDLVVAASAAVLKSLKDIAEKSLMQTRRPVLLAPQTSGADLTAPAMIAWDEVRNAGTRCLRPFPSSGSRVPSTSSASTATRPLAAPRRPRRSPICAATASARPRGWSPRTCARQAKRCWRRRQNMTSASW